MNRVSGRVTVRETGIGIPDLLVVVYDVDVDSASDQPTTPNPVPTAALLEGDLPSDRLGSALTDRNGAFELTYGDDEFGDEDEAWEADNPEEKRPDLLLAVLVPDESGGDIDASVLFTSATVRRNAGRTEQYLIRLPAEQLAKAGVPLPGPPSQEITPPQPVVERKVTTDLRVEATEDPEGHRTFKADLRVETTERSTPFVFLSYASVDRPRVLPLVQALRRAGVQVWIDQMAIAAGANYGREIAKGIRNCAALVLAVSPASLQSRNVKQEVQLAWKYEKPYLPLILEPTTFPPDFEYWLEGWQWVEVYNRPEQVWVREVMHALRKLPGYRPPGEESSMFPAARPAAAEETASLPAVRQAAADETASLPAVRPAAAEETGTFPAARPASQSRPAPPPIDPRPAHPAPAQQAPASTPARATPLQTRINQLRSRPPGS